MKNYHYYYLMGTIVIAPQMNEYIAIALCAIYMVLGLINSNQDT